VSVPDTIQGIIMARLDRLGEDGKRTVQPASVIGRQFLHRLLERIAGLAGQLEGLLQELKALEIIYEQGLLPEPAYISRYPEAIAESERMLELARAADDRRSEGEAILDLALSYLGVTPYRRRVGGFTKSADSSPSLPYRVHAACPGSGSMVYIRLYIVYAVYRVDEEADADEGLSGVNGG
jgi:hypothetical protein